jgi:hypothetical protein
VVVAASVAVTEAVKVAAGYSQKPVSAQIALLAIAATASGVLAWVGGRPQPPFKKIFARHL